MRKVKDILRLKHVCHLSAREIVISCNVSRSTVADYLKRAMAAGLKWDEASQLTETQLEARLFPTEHLPVQSSGLCLSKIANIAPEREIEIRETATMSF